jgi:hypothetical protein
VNTRDIERFINRPRVCHALFQGVFSADTLPCKPRLLICNTDPSHRPGEHWIAIFVDENHRGEYFDSFGRRSDEHFEHCMNEHSTSWMYNRRQLQSIISSFCGYYCCFFCILRSRGVNMIVLLAHFTSDTAFNDSIVHDFVCNKRNETYPPCYVINNRMQQE